MFLETHNNGPEDESFGEAQYCEKDGKVFRSQGSSGLGVCIPFRVRELLVIKRQVIVVHFVCIDSFLHSLSFPRTVHFQAIYRHGEG